jgi:predicted homoserine dehydrogenase-like protein
MLYEALRELEEQRRPIRVGIIGAGTFATQIITQMCRMVGMRASVVADLKRERATRALNLGGIVGEKVTVAETPEAINQAIDQGQRAATTSAAALIGSHIDVVIEATGLVEAAIRHGYDAIQARKHLVMVTVEADVLVGYLLKQLAEENGVIYSMAYGDEPALAYELWDWAKTLGFQVIAAGKGTRFLPEYRKANPDDVPRVYGFTGKDYNVQMFGSFLDGTKHAIEMTALCNATGLLPDVRGMHMPGLDLREIPEKLCLTSKGGILRTEGVVEAVSSVRRDGSPVERSIRGGVFAVLAAPDGAAIESLASYGEIIGMIIGKQSGQAMVYRPQHFVGHEVPYGIAKMMVHKTPIGVPIGRIAEVVAAAKKRLAPGSILDGEGGYCVYGLIEKAEIARAQNLVPIGLTQGAEVIREIPEDGMVTYENVRLPESFALDLRRRQDSRLR